MLGEKGTGKKKKTEPERKTQAEKETVLGRKWGRERYGNVNQRERHK